MSVAHKYGDAGNSFSLPQKVFKLGLGQGTLLVYLYLICLKSLKRDADEMSCAVIGKAVGMCRKTVQRHVCALVDKELVATENTSVFSHGLKVNGNLRYTLKPIRQVLKEREKELLAELKLAETQRKWNQHCLNRDWPRSPL